ncbi:MAG: hypothetical protein I3I98_08540 [Mobilibacterium timonense]|uniref:hypothetical protein n=1 Tax=Mobilibacterium timonense TaxID=1871012 RepID=UPI002357D164|nr:hypothetical protein [Mobilibacterium timonense]MBM6991420.1 hypothetical protein [Mobilibacterium timonense]
MLNFEELKSIGVKAVREMYGEEFLNKYKPETGLCIDKDITRNPFMVAVTADTKPLKNFRIGDETPSEFVAIALINPKTGEVHKDYANSRLPSAK